MLSINFNPSVLKAQNILNIASNNLNTSLQRLTTGMRINSAKDDPAGYYVAQGLNTQIRGLKTAQNNVSMGSSMLGIAEGSLSSMTDMLNRLNDLALQGASSTLSDSARGALTKEADAIVEEIIKLNKNTSFNGVSLFGNVSSPVEVKSVSSNTVPSGYTAIYTVDDLRAISDSKKYILMNDIDLSSVDDWSGLNFSNGTIDGNGHVIKNLKSDSTGLFESLSHATVKNLGLENVDINCQGGSVLVSGLSDYVTDSTISNCYVTGSVFSDGILGANGLVGSVSGGTISNCYFSGSVQSNKNLANGLAGVVSSGAVITNCYSEGTVRSEDFAGCGLVCRVSGGTISNCYTTVKGADYIIDEAESGSTIDNVWAVDNGIKTASSISGSTTATNFGVVAESEFKTHEFWDKNFDQTNWEMSFSIPPILKDVGGQNNNWYFKRGVNETRLQVGPDSDPAANAIYTDTGLDLGGMKFDFSTVEGCLDAVNCVKGALEAVTQKAANIGVTQSRLEIISNVNTTKIENLSAAYSTIMSADIAEETANYTKSQIMAETASSLITQAQYFQANLVLKMIDALG